MKNESICFVLATNNQNKIVEIRKIVGDRFEFSSLKESGIDVDIPEPHETLEENAFEKSSFIFKMTGKNVISEDTGLEVYGLNGKPGVYSARYAGEGKKDKENIEKLLADMNNLPDRRARFRTIVSLIYKGNSYFFEGICEGTILENSSSGTNGFGYDPIFQPLEGIKSFAEMTLEEKNLYSHRKKAVAKLLDFLQSLQ